MNPLDMILHYAEEHCPDIKPVYTLWLGTLTIEVMDTRTGDTYTRIFAQADVNVRRWFDELQAEV